MMMMHDDDDDGEVPEMAGLAAQSVARADTQTVGRSAGRGRHRFRPAWIGVEPSQEGVPEL